jgi:trehalose 6-phosphate phosphatase
MKDLLADAQRGVLARLAWSNAMLAFDFDGTLAPIVADPARAHLSLRTRRLLDELARLYPCVVISGRKASDVRARLSNVGLRGVIGNHGLEPLLATDALARRVRTWRLELERALDAVPGVVVEDKTYSLAVHYRRSRKKRTARAAIAHATASLRGARIVGGKLVVNVVPQRAPHKGTALERFRQRLGCETAFFLGDDETDEDVFALARAGRLVAVRVGRSRATAAAYYVARQSDVDELLRRLIDLRRGSLARSRPQRSRVRA